MLYFYYPSHGINHIEEFATIASLRATMPPGSQLHILPSGRVPQYLTAAIDHGVSFTVHEKFYDGRYFYFYGNRFTPEQLERLPMTLPRVNNYDHLIIANAIPPTSDARGYFLSLSHASVSKSIYQIIGSYTRNNNQIVGLEDINLLPTDLIALIWDKEDIHQMDDILFAVQNANVYFILTHPSQTTERFLMEYNKRYFAFANQIKVIADLHALFTAKILIAKNLKILQALGFNPKKGNGYYFAISNNNKYVV